MAGNRLPKRVFNIGITSFEACSGAVRVIAKSRGCTNSNRLADIRWMSGHRHRTPIVIAPQIVAFLKALEARIGQPLLIIWDWLRAHRSRLVRNYLDTLDGYVAMDFLPLYAPELNPVEYL